MAVGFLTACWALAIVLPILAAMDLYRFGWGVSETRHALGALLGLCFIPFSIFLTVPLVRGRGLVYIEDGTLIVYTVSYYSMPISAVRTLRVEDEGKSLVVRSADTIQKIPGFLIQDGVDAAAERWTAFKYAQNQS